MKIVEPVQLLDDVLVDSVVAITPATDVVLGGVTFNPTTKYTAGSAAPGTTQSIAATAGSPGVSTIPAKSNHVHAKSTHSHTYGVSDTGGNIDVLEHPDAMEEASLFRNEPYPIKEEGVRRLYPRAEATVAGLPSNKTVSKFAYNPLTKTVVGMTDAGFVVTTPYGNGAYFPISTHVPSDVIWVPTLGKFIACTSSGTSNNRILTSSSGMGWLTSSTPVDFAAKSICWAPNIGKVVVLGTSYSMSSSDGISWSANAISDIADVTIVGLVWHEVLNILIGVGYDTVNSVVVLLTSSDGASWTKTVTTVLRQPSKVVCGGNYEYRLSLLVDGAYGDCVFYTTDLINWTNTGFPFYTDMYFRDVQWDKQSGEYFVSFLSGFGDNVLYVYEELEYTIDNIDSSSIDGTGIGAVISCPDAGTYLLAHSGAINVGRRTAITAVSYGANPTALSPFATSILGYNHLKYARSWAITNYSWTKIIWANVGQVFHACGTNYTAYSSDGYTWAYVSNTGTWTCLAVLPTTGTVAVLSSGAAKYSMTGGVTWSSGTISTGQTWSSCCYMNGVGLIAVASAGTGSRCVTSFNATSWTNVTIDANAWNGICYSLTRGISVAVASSGTSRVGITSNGTSWSYVTVPARSWASVCWSNSLNIFCAVSSEGYSMVSCDGTTWTEAYNGTGQAMKDVIWVPKLSLFVAVATSGTGNRILVSPDGLSWSTRTSVGDVAWASLAWSEKHSKFVAVAPHTVTMQSIPFVGLTRASGVVI